MNCYKVKVRTTNSSKDAAYGAEADYVSCEDSCLYVIARSPASVEKIIKAHVIISIERIGLGYVADEEEPDAE